MFKKFQNRKKFPRQICKGHWTCADCGKEITELPFEPSPNRPVYCQNCWVKKKAERR